MTGVQTCALPISKEYIIYTPERRIGKSRALLKLANDYNAAIIASEHERDFLQSMARELRYENHHIISPLELQRRLPGRRVRTIIKTETVKIEDIRKYTSDYYIVGIEEV